jgi:hypothetical protein
MIATLPAFGAGWRLEHYNIVQRSPAALKAGVLILCLLVLAWFLKGVKKK